MSHVGFEEFPSFSALAVDFGRLRFDRGQRVGRGGMRLRTQLHVAPCLLRLPGDRLVMVDTGFDPALPAREVGVEWLPPQLNPLDQLSAQGIWPDDISDVVLTHLHSDHATGLLDRETGKSLFPNAGIHVQRLALQHAQESLAKGPQHFLDRVLVEWLVSHPRLEVHEERWQLCEELRAIHTGGHTPGHQVLFAGEEPGDENACLLLGGDMIPLVTALEERFRSSSDMEPDTAASEREVLRGFGGRLTYYLYHAAPGTRFHRASSRTS